MPDIITLFSGWWKQILVVVIISLVLAATIVFLKPDLYLSVTTAVPGNSLSSDKGRIFNENIEALYSDIGISDELDIIVGTAQLDTIYLAVTDQFNLFDHYKFSKRDGEGRHKSARRLKKNSRIIKSDYGELKVKVWDTDRNLAPQLANALMENLQKIHRDIQNSNNKYVLETLRKALESIQKRIDSLKMPSKNSESMIIRKNSLMTQREEYEKLIDQYEIIMEANPSALRITESARSALWADKPRRLEILIGTGIISLFFALLLSVFLHQRKRRAG
jgi:uncharacterized protein involved in exopolysaccharide biosynthesis